MLQKRNETATYDFFTISRGIMNCAGNTRGGRLSISVFYKKKNLNENEEKSSFTVHEFFLKKKSFTFGFVPERSPLVPSLNFQSENKS